MKKFKIIYWSGTGNTEIMAKAIADGGKKEGIEVEVIPVQDATKEHILEADYIALGSPASGSESIEEDYMEPFVASLSDMDLSGKPLGLFGSYDWGDGDWMRDWEERMEEYGANLIQEGVIANLEPSDDDLELCEALGRTLTK